MMEFWVWLTSCTPFALIYAFTIIDPTENAVNLKTPTQEPLILRLEGRILQKESVSQLMFFIILASFIWSVSDALKMVESVVEGPNTSWMLIGEVEKQVLPDILYPPMQLRQ